MASNLPANSELLLIVEDEEMMSDLIRDALVSPAREILVGRTAAEGRELFARRPSVVMLDVGLPDASGLDLLKEFLDQDPVCMIIMLTGKAEEELVVSAMQSGAMDYIAKPFSVSQVRLQVEKAFELSRRNRVAGLREETESMAEPMSRYLIGRSRPMVDLFKQVGRLADSGIPVLVTGESGVGKELVARALHRYGVGAAKPFVPVDCGSVPAGLLEAELFGYERGAFTGAVASKPGRFELAHGGTIFLDEIGNIPIELQADLLRAIQEKTSQRLGSTRVSKWDARIISATNADIREMVTRGTFRKDLFYRLAGVEVRVPALRERIDDLSLLVEHFLGKWKSRNRKMSITRKAMQLMAGYSWPGNVRELEHALDRAAALARGSVLGPDDLPAEIRNPSAGDASGQPVHDREDRLLSLEEVKRRHARMVLEACAGNKTEAARILGIDRKTLANLIEVR